MMGHTDRATINARKPLTARMKAVLRDLQDAATRGRRVRIQRLSQGDRNALRALVDRGLATYPDTIFAGLTDAGFALIAAGGARP